jgi:integrase
VERAGGEPLNFRSLNEFCQEWLESKATNKAESTIIRYKKVISDFLDYLGEKKASLSIASITPRDVQSFRDREVRVGKSEQTANLSLKTIRSLFIAAHRHGLITTNPAMAVETFDAEQQQRECFTIPQVQQILSVAGEEWRTAILFGYYLGARIGDCARMRWSNVDLEKKEIRYTPQKTKRGKELIIPMMPELEAQLLGLPSSDKAEDFLCPHLALKTSGGNHGLSFSFKRIMIEAGILQEHQEKKPGEGRRFNPLGFHSLRHTHVSELANSDVPAEVRQKISGHKSSRVHERYTHIETETKRKAMKKMRGVVKGRMKQK